MYMMEVAVMSHMAGAKKSSGLKLWPGLNEDSGLRLSWHSKMWKTSRQLNSPKNMPTAWTQHERDSLNELILKFHWRYRLLVLTEMHWWIQTYYSLLL